MREWIKREDDAALPSIDVLTLQKLIKPQMANLSLEAIDEMVRNHPDPERAEAHELVARSDIPKSALEAAERKLDQLLGQTAATLEGQPWLAGSSYSLADVAWTPFLDRMKLLGLAYLWEQGRPKLSDWVRRVCERPSYRTGILDYLSLG